MRVLFAKLILYTLNKLHTDHCNSFENVTKTQVNGHLREAIYKDK